MTFPELLEVTTPEAMHVMPDPELAGRHPFHDSRFLATFDRWDGNDCPADGFIVASMRDCQKQREEALRLTHSRNTLPALYLAARDVADNYCSENMQRLHAAIAAVHNVE
jgi:hypothetical protein